MFTLMKQNKDASDTEKNGIFSAEKRTRLIQKATAFGISLGSMSMFAMAAGTLDGVFGNLIGLVCKVFFYIGAVLLVWAIGQLVLAFKNEDADSKSRAVMVLVCAVLLLSINTIYTAVTSGLGGAISPTDISI